MEGPRLTRARQTSAVAQCAVHSPTKRPRSRQTAPATRQPPVCAIQPGRSLELRASLGLLQVRQLMHQQSSATTNGSDELTHSQGTKNRSLLKSARLQPLGIVKDELISSQVCLGIVPASAGRQRRPRSSTTPGVQFDIPNTTGSSNKSKSVKGKRRSQSAILARTIDTTYLMKMLSVSKHTGFQPQPETPKDDEIGTCTIEQSPPTLKPLPPVVKHGELGMKVEVRGLREEAEKTRSKDLTTKVSLRKKKLPPIPKTPSPTKQTEAIKSSPPLSPTSPSGSMTPSPRRSANIEPIRVSIVSVGERVTTGEHPRPRPNKRKSSGRLSRGWSPPQIVQPVTGSAVSSLSPQRIESRGEGGETTPINPNNSMLINISPSEFLNDYA